MTKIDQLTPHQEQNLKAFHREWLAIGTSTQLADRQRAQTAITAMYAEIGESAPRFIWCDSPATCLLAMQAIRQEEDDSLGDSLRADLLEILGDSLEKSLRKSLGKSLQKSFWASLRTSFQGSLRVSLWESLGESLGESLWESLREILGEILWECYWGQQEAYWVALYIYAQQIGVRYEPKRARQLEMWAEVSKSAGWWWPYKGTVIISERPSVIHMEPTGKNNANRLHCSDGPALAFRDGYSIYSIHGVRVPEQVVMAPATMTAKQITDELNAEVRRVMLERFGTGRYIQECGARKLHSDDWGTLWQADLLQDEPLVMVQLLNSTMEPDGSFKDYFLRVHPELRPIRPDGTLGKPQALTARNAVASTFGKQGKDYNPTIQT